MFILKILFAPLSLILSLFVWLCAGLLSCSGFVFKLASGLLSLPVSYTHLDVYKRQVFMDAYRENRALLRFHYHKSQTLLTRLKDLSLPRKEFRSDMAAIPATGRFITEDEIAASLANGSSFEGRKTRILSLIHIWVPPSGGILPKGGQPYGFLMG